MNLEDYGRLVRRHWAAIALSIGLGLAVAFGVSALMPKVYTADASGFVVSQSGGSTGIASLGDAYAKSRAKSYVEIAKNRTIAQAVIGQLDLKTTPQTLANQISASVPLDTVTLRITAQAATPQQAQDLANAWIRALAVEVQKLESGQVLTEGGAAAPAEGDPAGAAVVALVPGDTAVLPSAPSSPNLRLNLLLGALIGLALGIAWALVRSTVDKRIRSAAAVESTYDVSVVGTLPVDDVLAGAGRRLISTSSARADNEHLRLAEALRELRTNIQFLHVDDPPRVIVLTSPVPGDGKSTVVANLALAIAESGRRVVLVDGDLRRPTVAESFGVSGAAGLTDVLVGSAQIGQVLQRTAWHRNLYLLTSGTVPPNPSELVGTQVMRDLLRELSEHAIVLVDAPPLLPVTDGAILANQADGAIVVVRAGRTHIDELGKALSNLAKAGAVALGIVINRIPVKGMDRAGYGYYGGGYVGKNAGYVSANPDAAPLHEVLAEAER
ncbi:polysaccharide biosynthesis tyrosine autokinase [Microbacterium azadirachtae]|uniref:polysaccharide biosynthesis tyrosine autokinase n=1 Tax=Microbacterium azadirachtae TaxID=582680 RepID=UPI000880802D|nr:polysaccharide biosynthesis tyrosine autokinase [Microbacterium azadirachtae]SDM44473.1 capsular exopolysaccharide family [Microbacterium azadirachtae]SEG56512.1 capsular exopolysaccharide family [Microbacterium azadirachtae]SEG59359.1 capsular exopolysaccharide family [Microbacterium azadirachtae]